MAQRGLFGDIADTMMSPLFLGGASLLSGGGMGGAMQGMQMGSQWQEQQRQRGREQAAADAVYRMPGNLTMADRDVLAANPQLAQNVLGTMYANRLDPQAKLKLDMMRAQIGHMGTQDRVAQAQLQQLKMQTPEFRADLAIRSGMKPGTNEYNAFVLNGTFQPRDPMEGMIADMLKQNMSGSAAPQGGVTPQSNAGEGVPQTGIVLTGAGEQPQQPTGTTAGSNFQNMAPQQKRSLAEIMLLNPKTKAMGEQLIKDLEQGSFGKEGRNEIDKKLLTTGEGIARLDAVKNSFRPEYQTIENRLGYAWNAGKEKLFGGRAPLKPEQKAELEAYTGYRADAVDNLNQYIKEITGAAMTESEAKRIMQGMPNAGSGIFDGDSPTEFQAKLKSATDRLKMAHARHNYAQKTGQSWTAIGLHQMNGVVQQRTNELQGLYQKQGLSGDDLKTAVRQGLKKDFGI